MIAAGHTHAGLADQVNGIGIIQPFSRSLSFGRVDVVFDPAARRVARLELFPPRPICAHEGSRVRELSRGRLLNRRWPPNTKEEGVTSDPAIVHAMEPALQRVETIQASLLGLSLDAAIRRVDEGRSPLGNLIAEALREAVPGADVAVINNAGAAVG